MFSHPCSVREELFDITECVVVIVRHGTDGSPVTASAPRRLPRNLVEWMSFSSIGNARYAIIIIDAYLSSETLELSLKIEFETRPVVLKRSHQLLMLPVVEVGFLHPTSGDVYRREVLIDTGAHHCIFPTHLASKIGITDLKSLPEIDLGTGGGTVKARETLATLSIVDPSNSKRSWTWTTQILLSDASLSHYGVLGTLGFLEFFRFDLDEAHLTFWLQESLGFPGTTHHR